MALKVIDEPIQQAPRTAVIKKSKLLKGKTNKEVRFRQESVQ